VSSAEEPGCIYCGLGRPSSKEHVVPYAIGGRYDHSGIICQDCNSYFGARVDPHITDWHLSLLARNWFDLEGQSGSVPSYEVVANDGTVLTAGRKGILRPKWRDVESKQDGKNFCFRGGTPTVEEAQRALANVIAKQTRLAGRPPTVTESSVEVRVRREWKPFEAVVEYDYGKQGRAIAKMAFHYLATHLDRRFLCTRDFEPVARFVRHGEHGHYPRLCQPAIPPELEPTAEPCIQHSLTLRCSREVRSAVSDVVLFGVLRFSVVLSYSYEGPNLFRRLVLYPLENRFEEGPAPDLTPIPAKLILDVADDERRARCDRLEDSVYSLVDWLNLYGFCHHIRETLPAVIDQVSSQVPFAGYAAERWLAAVADGFSDRSAPAALLHFQGEPSRVAAEIISAELCRLGGPVLLGPRCVEKEFARLLFIRLLVDALVLAIQSRDGRARTARVRGT